MDDGASISRWEAYERRVPSSLEDLRGQATGRRICFRAHEMRDDTPLPEIAGHVRNAFRSAGYNAELVEATGRYARLTLRLPGSGEALEMDLLKEALEPSFVTVQVTAMTSVRALSLEDTVGLKARAWHDRFVIRDIIDLQMGHRMVRRPGSSSRRGTR